MGWSVGFDSDHDRWRGYGVPAYCDAKGCNTEIDRGFGYLCFCEECDETDALEKVIFVCGDHTCADVDENNLPDEHPDWLNHQLTDDSWSKWRAENPQKVIDAYWIVGGSA